ncbi:DUF4433 domain-containing protein [Chitinophaga horti]|uniref:DUF4433 domain-containing protein n=1 Tax=Chitinophaga horti TaxID=2920382 RepID=A0ABY6J2S8_9BACT|nr:DUF4433 domain-containing protein [Chitinophaga horti]UYQ92666.1 DUF4433 domain-containing protein [Chitinophaga horti]
MTHIRNVPHILKHGITHVASTNANPQYVPIGDDSLIATRKDFILDNGTLLGSYIPFYFGARMPMLYVIQRGFNMVTATLPADIVYCITSVYEIEQLGIDYVFTDGHSVNSFSLQYDRGNVDRILDLVDWDAVSSKYWNREDDLDLKRRKEAEFLVRQDIPVSAILGYIVYNEAAKARLTALGIEGAKIVIKPDAYF